MEEFFFFLFYARCMIFKGDWKKEEILERWMNSESLSALENLNTSGKVVIKHG